jgi:hypothetical protein
MIGDCYFARFFRVDVLMMGTFTGFEGPAIVQNDPFDFLKLHNLIIRTMRIKCQGDFGSVYRSGAVVSSGGPRLSAGPEREGGAEAGEGEAGRA